MYIRKAKVYLKILVAIWQLGIKIERSRLATTALERVDGTCSRFTHFNIPKMHVLVVSLITVGKNVRYDSLTYK